MAAKQYVLPGFPFPVFINETGTKDYVLPGIFINETDVTTGSLFIPAPMNGLGSGGPFFADRLAT